MQIFHETSNCLRYRSEWIDYLKVHIGGRSTYTMLYLSDFTISLLALKAQLSKEQTCSSIHTGIQRHSQTDIRKHGYNLTVLFHCINIHLSQVYPNFSHRKQLSFSRGEYCCVFQFKDASPRGLSYVFAHYCGIFLTSSIFLIVYVLYKRNRPFVNNRSILPAYITGTMWAIAQTAWLVIVFKVFLLFMI